MRLTIIQVDAFTNKPFAGNPAAVCVLPEPRDERWMQDVARETPITTQRREGAKTQRIKTQKPFASLRLCAFALKHRSWN